MEGVLQIKTTEEVNVGTTEHNMPRPLNKKWGECKNKVQFSWQKTTRLVNRSSMDEPLEDGRREGRRGGGGVGVDEKCGE